MVYRTIGSGRTSMAGKPYPEIVDLAAGDGSVLVVPVGSVEQHGYHLPVGTDTLLADAVAREGAERVADDLPVLVTPPITPGYSPHHMDFGGTLTLEFEHMLAVVEDAVAAGLDSGFDAVLLVNGHGGNMPLVDAATSTIGVDHPGVTVAGLTYFALAEPFIDEIRDSDAGGMGHAGEFETSLMLYLRPELVREDAMAGTYMDDPHELTLEDMFEGGRMSVYRSFTEYSESGAIGDPNLASAEKGEAIYDGICGELASTLRELHGASR